jgi:hypothetical protein
MTLVYYEVIIHHHFIHTLRQVALENVKQKKMKQVNIVE